jgi:hypothetical protein
MILRQKISCSLYTNPHVDEVRRDIVDLHVDWNGHEVEPKAGAVEGWIKVLVGLDFVEIDAAGMRQSEPIRAIHLSSLKTYQKCRVIG